MTSCSVWGPLCVSRLREGVRKMEEKHFSEHNDEHVEFLPVEWRSKLALDGGQCVSSLYTQFLMFQPFKQP